MPQWITKPIWEGEDAFIIGGGPSLQTFDWNVLRVEKTIGCNTAYIHGSDICKICLFGDKSFFQYHEDGLKDFTGVVVTNLSKFKKANEPWVWFIPRVGKGLGTAALGWNGNTGASAINLALILGAKRIFLLGFDMKRTVSRSNWHDIIINEKTVRNCVYEKFNRDFQAVVRDWHEKFPDREIINVTDDSDLDGFPKVETHEFWEGRRQWQSEQLQFLSPVLSM